MQIILSIIQKLLLGCVLLQRQHVRTAHDDFRFALHEEEQPQPVQEVQHVVVHLQRYFVQVNALINRHVYQL